MTRCTQLIGDLPFFCQNYTQIDFQDDFKISINPSMNWPTKGHSSVSAKFIFVHHWFQNWPNYSCGLAFWGAFIVNRILKKKGKELFVQYKLHGGSNLGNIWLTDCKLGKNT